MTFKYFISLMVLCSAAVTGCFGTQKPAGFPSKLYPCEITMTADGQPLDDARVELIFQDNSRKDWASNGITDQNGVVQLYTYGRWKGVPAGMFKVTVAKETAEGPDGDETIFTLIDPLFSDAKTTTLTLKIDGKTNASFDVGPIKKLKKQR